MKRRDFIINSSMGVGSILVGSSLFTLLESCDNNMMNNIDMNMNGQPVTVKEGNFDRLLPIPKTVSANTVLTAQETTANIEGKNIAVLGYQANSILGPTIRINNGSNAGIIFQNNLLEKSNIHWHGLKIPADMDGHPESVVNPGSSFNYQFNVDQRAGLYWYHPHPHGATASEVFFGLAGLFIINDAEESALNLPSGRHEIPMVIQDKRFTSSGIRYSPSMGEVMSGYMGDTVIVNGEVSPYTEVSTRFYRLRLLNGSNARIYNLAFDNNTDLIIIGNDGGLLPNPVATKSILISPGERLDVLVNFSGMNVGTELFLESRIFDNGGNAQGKQTFKILKFKVTQSETDDFILPLSLSSVNPIPLSSSSKTRNFVIKAMQMSSGMNMTGIHKINDKIYDKNRIDELVSANSTELWVFDNSQGDEPHPIHLHGVQFQVLERIGGRNKLSVSEFGFKDTVLVLPREIVKIIIPFTNNKGVYVFHCHNLEHEDDGMMLQYQIS